MRALLFAVLLTACGAATTPPPEPREPSGAVRARLGGLAEPPVAWSTHVATLSDDDFGRICPWLAEHVGLEAPAVTCPDGRTVEPYTYECDPSHSGPSARARCRAR